MNHCLMFIIAAEIWILYSITLLFLSGYLRLHLKTPRNSEYTKQEVVSPQLNSHICRTLDAKPTHMKNVIKTLLCNAKC